MTLCGEPYETHDPVFGAMASLVVDLGKVDQATAQKYNVKSGIKLLEHEFVLVTNEEAAALRREEAKHVLGSDVRFVKDRPVPAGK